MTAAEKIENASVWTAAIAVTAIAWSVSVTHVMIFFSFMGFFIISILNFKTNASQFNISGIPAILKKTTKLHPFFLSGIAIFSILLLSGLLNNSGKNLKWLYSSDVSEFKDVALMIFGIILYSLSKKEKNKNRFIKALEIAAVILIASGIISAFSEFRLSKILTGHGFTASADNRAQYPLFNIYGIQIYRPIGLMNTRLTYAGLLILIVPYLTMKIVEPGKIHYLNRKFSVVLAFSAIILLFINGSRSALIGLFGSLLFLCLSPHSLKKIKYYTKKYRFNFTLISFFILTFVLFSIILPQTRHIYSKVQNRIFRYTDYQRPIIWKGAREIIATQPILGTGPGNFRDLTIAFRNNYIENHPQTMMLVINAPDGHAHNDLLHLTTAGGFAAGIFFLILSASVGAEIFKPVRFNSMQNLSVYLASGMAAFLIAGTAQCYFQDDEVVILFWILAGLTASENFGLRRNT